MDPFPVVTISAGAPPQVCSTKIEGSYNKIHAIPDEVFRNNEKWCSEIGFARVRDTEKCDYGQGLIRNKIEPRVI